MHTQMVTFYLADRLYGIGVNDVQEVLPPRRTTRVALAEADVAGLVNLRGQVVLALDMRSRLRLPPADAEQMLVVVRLPEGPVALMVDRVGEVIEVDPESIEPPPSNLTDALREVLDGAYKLTDQLLLALDVHAATTTA